MKAFKNYLKYLLYLLLLVLLLSAMIAIIKNIDQPQRLRLAAFAQQINSQFKKLLNPFR